MLNKGIMEEKIRAALASEKSGVDYFAFESAGAARPQLPAQAASASSTAADACQPVPRSECLAPRLGGQPCPCCQARIAKEANAANPSSQVLLAAPVTADQVFDKLLEHGGKKRRRHEKVSVADDIAGDPETLQAALKRFDPERYGGQSKSVRALAARVQCYVRIIELTGMSASPLTVRKATAFLAVMTEAKYTTADDYYFSVAGFYKRCGMCDLSDADELHIRSCISRQRRGGNYGHEQAEAVMIDEVVALAKAAKKARLIFAAGVCLIFIFALRISEALMIEWSEDLTFNSETSNWELNLTRYLLKSNTTRRVFVKCLCKTCKWLCPCKWQPVLARAGPDPLGDFRPDFQNWRGHGRTHSLRIGMLHFLVRSLSVNAQLKIQTRMRWAGPDMIQCCNRGNKYQKISFEKLRIIPES